MTRTSSREVGLQDHVRYYEVAGITIQVESDLPITDTTFSGKFAGFRVESPGDDLVVIRHHFGIPDLRDQDLGREVYRESPWAIYRGDRSWFYLGIAPDSSDPTLHCFAELSLDHSNVHIYNSAVYEQAWRRGRLASLTMFPTDQILLARLLADRRGCLLHSGGLLIDGHGLLFVGHSEAGKSTTMQLVRRELGDRVEILCDDRNAVRLWPDGFQVHGTWSHGDVPDVSSASGALRGVLFLEQYEENQIVPVEDRKVVWQRLLATLVKPLVTAEWWHSQMDVLEQLVGKVPCYAMRFDKSGAIVAELECLVR